MVTCTYVMFYQQSLCSQGEVLLSTLHCGSHCCAVSGVSWYAFMLCTDSPPQAQVSSCFAGVCCEELIMPYRVWHTAVLHLITFHGSLHYKSSCIILYSTTCKCTRFIDTMFVTYIVTIHELYVCICILQKIVRVSHHLHTCVHTVYDHES